MFVPSERVGERRLSWPDRICYAVIALFVVFLIWRIL